MSGVREKVRFRIRANKKHESLIRSIVPTLPTIYDEDEIVVNYDLHFDYMGNTYDQLTRIETLMHRQGVVSTADLSALNGGRILLKDLILKIEQIMGRLQ